MRPFFRLPKPLLDGFTFSETTFSVLNGNPFLMDGFFCHISYITLLNFY